MLVSTMIMEILAQHASEVSVDNDGQGSTLGAQAMY